ncbi:FAD-dependent monooxygenase [Microbacterium sp. 10M-3C3]|jgi:2-polyprenyl-6-methoxyphenol hydroxylase-like FAD-dependent oxidoreductase|uniref:FAD-dependent monooxygenase n=1 Tax=Microbacterium sp. 10M-3C3 TaxID=2483401 RepID=UPI000F62D010|nr:FAD-dependent monooxygenase [Microbacterium sp. 10M-3C3]
MTKVLIVGGGPAGMAAALALSQANVETEIVEASDDWRPGGIGLALQSAPQRATMQLGIYDELRRVGRRHDVIDMCGPDGRLVAQMPQININGPDDAPLLGMARESIHDVMVAAVERAGVPVRLGTTIADLDDGDGGASVTFTDGTTGEYDWIVGADGAHSALRARLLPDAPPLSPAGQSIWRAAAICPPGLEHYTMMLGGPIRLGLVPLPDGRLYLWMLDSESGGERPPRDEILDVFRAKPARFGGFAPAVIEQLTDAAQIDFRALTYVLVPPPWHAGHVLLIGDAVHTTTPHISYGAGLALEDAVVLGELAPAGLPFEQMATELESRRFERARLVVETSLQLSRWEQSADGPPDPSAPGRLIGQTLAALSQPL